MSHLPYVTQGYDVPPEQPVVAGEAADYVGIYVVGDEPRIVMTLTNPFLKFGRVENWSPEFVCDVPVDVSRSPNKERFFQLWFTGVPTERESFVSGKLCVRKVCVTHISKIFEGKDPPMVR